MTDTPNKEWKIRVRIDDKKIPLNRFVQDAFTAVITGLVSSLKDVPAAPLSIRVEIDRRDDADGDAE